MAQGGWTRPSHTRTPELWGRVLGSSSGRLSSTGGGPNDHGARSASTKCIPRTVTTRGSQSSRNHITSTSAPLSVATKKGKAQHPVSAPSPPSGLTLNHEDLILYPPQQGWGKVTCESLLRVRGRNRRYLCSHVIGAPAKCCTSGTAVNKAGEAAEPEWTAARGSRDLQPRSSQWGEGVQKAELPRGVRMPKTQAHSPAISSS